MTMRIPVGLAVLAAVAGMALSGGAGTDSVRHRYLPRSNVLRTVIRYGDERRIGYSSLGSLNIRSDRSWVGQAKSLSPRAPSWARRMYRRSLEVLRGLTDRRTGAALAGARPGWDYVWPRDASATAMALAAAGYRPEARGIVRFLLGLDLGAAARFSVDGMPVGGRAAQGDATGWVDAAARAAGLGTRALPQAWRGRADYEEGGDGNYLGNAIAAGAADAIRREFETAEGTLTRDAGDPGSGLDSVAAWAVRPFGLRSLYRAARRTLLRIAARSSRFGIVPSEGWEGGDDPWTAPTAWTAWSLAALGERRAALRLMDELRRDATPTGLLPERVDGNTGVPVSTTPLAWSHAFAILALRQLWP